MPKRAKLARAVIVIAVAGCLIGAAVTALVWYKDYPVHHFGVVQEGVLYRSAQPDAKGWEVIANKYHIKTVVSLRGDQTNEATTQPWWQEEEAFCGRGGIGFVNIPIGKKVSPEDTVREFLKIVTDPRNQPVLVHCEFGSARTGLAAGAYRIVVQGWTYDAALKEAKGFRFKPDKLKEYDALLRKLGAGQGRAATGPKETVTQQARG